MSDDIIRITPYTLEEHARLHNAENKDSQIQVRRMTRGEVMDEFGEMLTSEQLAEILKYKPKKP